MAVVLYKDGEVVRVAIGSVQSHLNAGWGYSKEKQEEKPKPIKQIRAEAKAANIPNWDTARTKTLLAALNAR